MINPVGDIASPSRRPTDPRFGQRQRRALHRRRRHLAPSAGSSSKAELVVVVESPISEARMCDMFKAVDAMLRWHNEVGGYNQTIESFLVPGNEGYEPKHVIYVTSLD